MKFSIGDKVRFLNEDMEGVVSSIIDQQTVGVTVNNDFEIPVPVNQVVKISFSDFFGAPKTDAVVPKQAEKGFDERIYASFVQMSDSLVDLCFVNHTPNPIFLNYYAVSEGITLSKFFDSIEPFDYKVVDKLQIEKFADWPEFNFQVLIKPEGQAFVPVVNKIKMQPSKFFKHLRATPLLNKQGYLFPINEELTEEDLDKLKNIDFNSAARKESNITPVLNIVDLHIDKLHNNYTQLTKQETFNIQLGHFEKNLDSAIAHGMQKITFIHGVGNGKLKNEIWKILKQNSAVKRFEEADQKEFGYGATTVFLTGS
jgi:hypothetical protein